MRLSDDAIAISSLVGCQATLETGPRGSLLKESCLSILDISSPAFVRTVAPCFKHPVNKRGAKS
jgi:hypothetical protein